MLSIKLPTVYRRRLQLCTNSLNYRTCAFKPYGSLQPTHVFSASWMLLALEVVQGIQSPGHACPFLLRTRRRSGKATRSDARRDAPAESVHRRQSIHNAL